MASQITGTPAGNWPRRQTRLAPGNADYGNSSESGALLALAAGLRETGWAVFHGSTVTASGVAGLKTRRKVEPSDRIAHQMNDLSAVALRWQAVCAVRSKADGINWRAPGLERLDGALHIWADGLAIPLFDYTIREVRAAVAGQPNASREALCYAIMRRLGLIGQSRATAEWEAIAVGYYHSALRQDEWKGQQNPFVDSVSPPF